MYQRARVVNWKKQTTIVLCSNDTERGSQEIYGYESCVRVAKECNTANIFNNACICGEGYAGTMSSAEFDGVPVPDTVEHNTNNWGGNLEFNGPRVLTG